MSTDTITRRNYDHNLQERSRASVVTDHRDNLASQCTDLMRTHGRSIRWKDFARETIRWSPEYAQHGMPQNDQDMVRTAISNPDIAEAWSAVADSFITEAFASAPVNSAGWVRQTPVGNFLSHDTLAVTEAGRMERHTRGGTASDMEMGLSSTAWSIARYSSRVVLDETELLNDQVGAAMALFEQLGRAARCLSEDLVFSLLLSNPTLADSVALFDAGHGNAGTAALADTAFYAARAAIGSQVLTDEAGDPTTHLNLCGKILMVPPDLEGKARELVRAASLNDSRDIEVRSESRLSATGVIDPETGDVRVGSATNWLLAAPHDAWPCILVGALRGNFAPKIRKFTLDQGQWGLGWDVNMDIGAVAVAHQGLYWSTGAGA